ncbi:hypothetical protein PGT21_022900 [Puccinia graminis f. sp. tritici]|uniref:Uncharacterized protein n=1 Tax=Puccinia graminis f. sp. tritici TaxID=56615 RepID=A0A5B0QJ81_PUCGR|nr:hypothetical protein PGT21_022900 [Puccinia graminis f. sp. tritici]
MPDISEHLTPGISIKQSQSAADDGQDAALKGFPNRTAYSPYQSNAIKKKTLLNDAQKTEVPLGSLFTDMDRQPQAAGVECLVIVYRIGTSAASPGRRGIPPEPVSDAVFAAHIWNRVATLISGLWTLRLALPLHALQ